MVISTSVISKPKPKYSQGLSITEIMVALVISSILMAGVYIIFDSSKKTYTLQGEMAELNDNARFIMDEFKQLISEAGYGGCQGTIGGNPFLQTTYQPNPNNWNDQTITTLNGVNKSDFPASDILTIRYYPQLKRINASTTGLDSGSSDITLTNNSVVPNNGDTITVSDCAGNAPDTYTVSNVPISNNPWTSVPITISPNLLRNYLTPVDIFLGDINNPSRITYKVIYDNNARFTLLKCEGIDADNDGDVCDDLSNDQQQASRFIEGVQNMQIRYGIDDDGDNNLEAIDTDTIPSRYAAATALAPNSRIISLRITLLMRTLNKRGIGIPGNPKAFNLDSQLSSPFFNQIGIYEPHNRKDENKANFSVEKLEEGYRHRLFSTTIFIRNSVYPY
jgi:type IV pilus assembly protein PilW